MSDTNTGTGAAAGATAAAGAGPAGAPAGGAKAAAGAKPDDKKKAGSGKPKKLISLTAIDRGAEAEGTAAFAVFTEADAKEAQRLVDVGAATPWTAAAEKKLVAIIAEQDGGAEQDED